MKIGIFDSGIGGLNVLKEIIKKCPYNKYYYYGDTKNVPYGEKSKETLFDLASDIIKFFENLKVDIIIIACGTISSNCYLELKKITKIKIYDILSPTFNYLKNNNFSNMVVFATKRTIESHIFKNNLKDIKEIATKEFVNMIENNKIDTEIVKKYMELVKDNDTLILGCTHYPCLINEFKKYKKNIKIVDMGKVMSNSLNLEKKDNLEVNLYFTKLDKTIEKNIANILNIDYKLELIESK